MSIRAFITLAYRHNPWLTLHNSQSLERRPLLQLNIQPCFVYTTLWKLQHYHGPLRKYFVEYYFRNRKDISYARTSQRRSHMRSDGLPATARTTSLRPNEHGRATSNVKVMFSDKSVALAALRSHAEPPTRPPSRHLLDRSGRLCRITLPPSSFTRRD
jgi:hypothetical protein